MTEKLREQRGEILLDSALKLLIWAIVLSAGVEIFHVYHTLGLVREKTNEAVLAVAAVNVAAVLHDTQRMVGHLVSVLLRTTWWISWYSPYTQPIYLWMIRLRSENPSPSRRCRLATRITAPEI